MSPAELPPGWRILTDRPKRSVVILHESGLWTEVFEPYLSTMSPDDRIGRVVWMELDAAVRRGVHGRVYIVVTHEAPPGPTWGYDRPHMPGEVDWTHGAISVEVRPAQEAP
jgi:hypothetical protein